jgi:hypothetical protein
MCRRQSIYIIFLLHAAQFIIQSININRKGNVKRAINVAGFGSAKAHWNDEKLVQLQGLLPREFSSSTQVLTYFLFSRSKFWPGVEIMTFYREAATGQKGFAAKLCAYPQTLYSTPQRHTEITVYCRLCSWSLTTKRRIN